MHAFLSRVIKARLDICDTFNSIKKNVMLDPQKAMKKTLKTFGDRDFSALTVNTAVQEYYNNHLIRERYNFICL